MACIFCNSKLHNYRSCPVAYKLQKKPVSFKQDYYGKSPNVFVGRYGYPNVRVGILGTEEYADHDSPSEWSKKETPINEIVQLRSELVNSAFSNNVKGSAKFTQIAKDVSLSRRPVDVEVNMTKRPSRRFSFNKDALPFGPTVPLKQAAVTENIPVDRKVDKAVLATDLKATEAISMLSKRNIDPYYLTKVFSMGNLGIPAERKMVPTRWSITAVDDIRGKDHIKKLRDFKESDCLIHFAGHYGNYYLLLFFDDLWQYELLEQYLPDKRDHSPQMWTDHETYKGRKEYAKETAGGYYAARIGITERLMKMKRQSAVLTIRIITDEYDVPLGVWVCREAVKKALETEPLQFADRRLMLEYAKQFLQRRFSYDIDPFMKRSKLIRGIFGQKKLQDF